MEFKERFRGRTNFVTKQGIIDQGPHLNVRRSMPGQTFLNAVPEELSQGISEERMSKA